jgi:hypothetical protein
MMLGMVGCEEPRKTLMASSLIVGIRLMSTKLGSPELGPGFGDVAFTASPTRWWLGAGAEGIDTQVLVLQKPIEKTNAREHIS